MAGNKQTRKQRAVLKALEEHHGVVSDALKATRTGRITFDRWMNFDSDFRATVEAIDDLVVDFVESKLFDLIADRNRYAIIFFLRTRGRRRGYVLKDELAVGINHQVKADVKFDFSKLPSNELRQLGDLARRSRATGESDQSGTHNSGE